MTRTTRGIASLVMTIIIVLSGYNNAGASALNSIGYTYYVSTNGNDSNPGTLTAPFKTFAKATSMLNAGDTLLIFAGVYHEQLKVSKNGVDTAGLTIKPFDSAVVIDMQNAASSAVELTGSYITVAGIEVKGSNDICVKLLGQHLVAAGLVVHGCQTHGIYITGQHIEAAGNTVYGTSMENQSRSSSNSWGSAIKVGLGGNDILIHDNTIYHNYGEGIASTRGSNVTMRANNVYDNFSVNIYVDNSFNVLTERNFVTCHANSGFERDGNPATGIALGEEYYAGWGAQLNYVTIRNNLVAFCKQGVYYFGPDASVTGGGLKNSAITYNTLWDSTDTALGIIYGNSQTSSVIANNIIWQANNKLAYVENSTGLTFQNNLWKVTPPVSAKGSNDRIGAPAFSTTPGYSADTFQLGASSPAIGGAANIGIATDYFGNTRGPSYDMGALEFSGVLPTPTSTPIAASTVTPSAVWTPTATTVPPTAASSPTSTSEPTIVVAGMPTSTLLPTITSTFTSEPPIIATSTLTPTAVPSTPTAVPSSPTPISTASEKIYNDTNPLLLYSANWKNITKDKAYGGSYKQTTVKGSSVSLKFTGQSFSLLYTTGVNFGKVQIYVDNQLVATLNQKTAEIHFQKKWNSEQLANGSHELRLVFAGPDGSKGTLDAIIVH